MFIKKSQVLVIYVLISYVLFTLSCSSPGEKTRGSQPKTDDLLGELVPIAYQTVVRGLASPNPRIRTKAIEVVATTRQITLLPKVARLLKDDYPPVRFAACLAIGDLQYSLVENSLQQLLKDEDKNVCIAAAYALSRLGFPDKLAIVRKAIASDDQTVRANAALLLGKAGNRDDLKFLYWALQRDDSADKVRFTAAEAIARLQDERIYPKLWTMLISAYADDRVFGIRAMGTLGTEDAKNAIMTMLNDDILEVRLAAAGQLGMLGETIGASEVVNVFTKDKDLVSGMDEKDRQRIYVLAALAIGEIGSQSLIEFLPRLLESESEFVRIAAAKATLQCAMKQGTNYK